MGDPAAGKVAAQPRWDGVPSVKTWEERMRPDQSPTWTQIITAMKAEISDLRALRTQQATAPEAGPQFRECRHCGWECRPNPTPAKKGYPLEPEAIERRLLAGSAKTGEAE